MHFRSIAVVGLLVVGAAAAPAPPSYTLHEKRAKAPSAWQKRSNLAGTDILPVRIGLKQRNLDKAYDLLMEVSEHNSQRYGKYYSAEEVVELFSPSFNAVDAVREWLENSGIAADRVTRSFNKQWLQFEAATSELEELLKTEYHLYEHETTGKHNIACDEYHVPEHVKQHIDYITPGIKLFVPTGKTPRKQIEKRNFGVTSKDGAKGITPPKIKSLPGTVAELLALPVALACNTAISPDCIKLLYNITDPTTAVAGNELGIFEGVNDKYAQADLDDFFAAFALNIPLGTHPTLKSVDGATAPETTLTAAGSESDLDFQISYPIIYPQQSILFQTDDDVYEANYTFQGFLNTFLDAIDGSYCTNSAFGETGDASYDPQYPNTDPAGYQNALQCGAYTPTNVISISYGGQEADLPTSYQERQCNEFMKLGLQGVSVVVASGDSGVAGPPGDDTSNGCLADGTVFSPGFPANCPYVTVLGATYLPHYGSVGKDEEVAVTRFPSGGGFSNIYPIPAYQASAVATYLSASDPPYEYYSVLNATADQIPTTGGVYNRVGRGYPDFAAIGDNIAIFHAGAFVLIGGTSAAAPTFAAILTRINEERLLANKTTIGFVNPTLYANRDVLHDITVGSNPGCGVDGFSVAPGWDPVTGLGTPNYPAMLALFLSLP